MSEVEITATEQPNAQFIHVLASFEPITWLHFCAVDVANLIGRVRPRKGPAVNRGEGG
jgi:hypothetical protein